MSDNSWGKKAIEELASDLLSAICGVTIEEAKRRRRDWRNAQNIVKTDSESIEQQFRTSTFQEELVRNFFKEKVIPSYRYYSVHSLNDSEEESLWKDFWEYLSAQDIDVPEDDLNSLKRKLIFCVNIHNEIIRKSNLTTSEELSQSVTQRGFENVEAILRQIEDTLCLSTDLQAENIKLDYLTQQIESILKSIRIDLQKSRSTISHLMVYMIVIILIAAISIGVTLRYVTERITTIESLFFLVLFIIVFIPLLYTTSATKEKEKQLNEMCNSLLQLHYKKYSSFLDVEEYSVLDAAEGDDKKAPLSSDENTPQQSEQQ